MANGIERTIDLTPEQSDALNLEADGDYGAKFIVLSRETHPGDPQRWRLWIKPSTAIKVNKALRALLKAPTNPKKDSTSLKITARQK